MNTPAIARLAVGIGCRRGTSAEAIEQAVRIALGTRGFGEIAIVASIDAKRNESGLRVFCERHSLPLRFFSAADLTRAPRTTRSHQTAKHMNVDGVCEPCALLAGNADALIVPKTSGCGVSVAMAVARGPFASEA